MMHNWNEGILQHHARVKWGIGVIPSHLKDHDPDHGQPNNDGTPTAETNLGFIDINTLDNGDAQSSVMAWLRHIMKFITNVIFD